MSLDPDMLGWIFLVGGVLLMSLEAVLPGGIWFFLGLGGVLVSVLSFLDVVTSPELAIALWLVASAALTLSLRPFARRYFGGTSSSKVPDEDLEAMDQEVPVLDRVTPTSGRIRFRGAVWQARTLEGALPEGSKARLKYRDNLTWIVEPAGGYIAEVNNDTLPAPDGDTTRNRPDRPSRSSTRSGGS